jgi:hypothetical protein
VEGDDDATAAATTWLGFDLDHTLAQYNVAPCTAMLLETAATVLAQQGKLPNAASLAVRTPPRGLQLRGAVGDKELGNVLWLDGDARVARGWHGSRELSAAVLAATYGAEAASGAAARRSPSASGTPSPNSGRTAFGMKTRLVIRAGAPR